MFSKLLKNDVAALLFYGVLIFGLPAAWVCNAYIHGQRPFATPAPASAPIPTR
ncbi:MAG: hypothetical protein ACYCZX_02560 [Rhodospirillaceae bacterium]